MSAPGDRPPYGIRLQPNPYTVRIDDDGNPRTPIAPYGAVAGACRLCPAKCCRSKVNVSLPDALRLSSTLGVPLFSLLTVVPSESEHAFRLDADARWATAEPWAGRAELALKRLDDGRCRGLIEFDGYFRCGIYAARPSFCRTYPVRWSSNVAHGGPAVLHCPIPYGIDDAEAETLVMEIERQIDDWNTHDEIVAAWNASAGPFTIEAFVEVAVTRAREATGLHAPDALAPGTPDERLAQAMRSTSSQAWPQVRTQTFAGLPLADSAK